MEDTKPDKKIQGLELQNLINNAHRVAVVPSKFTGVDSFCAALGLYHLLLQKGKHTSFIYSGNIPKVLENFDLISPEEMEANTGDRSLVVSIDYSDTPAANVQYSNEDNVLELIVSPVTKDFDISERLKAKVTGFKFDLVITVGLQALTDLGSVYENLREELSQTRLVNLDNTGSNTGFGYVNIVDTSKDNLSQLVFDLAVTLGISPNIKSAKALLIGMTYREPTN